MSRQFTLIQYPRKIFAWIAKFVFHKEYLLLVKRTNAIRNQLSLSPNRFEKDLLVKFLISGEDHRFNYHIGFDIIAIFRAFKNRIFYNKKEGASTIEQQLVRIIIDDYDKTLRRKIKEILLATTLFEFIPKNDLPIIYLHVAYYGTELQGLNKVFDRLQKENINYITEDIAAEIVAKIKYPEPRVPSERRQSQIISRKRHLISLYRKHSSRKFFKIYGQYS